MSTAVFELCRKLSEEWFKYQIYLCYIIIKDNNIGLSNVCNENNPSFFLLKEKEPVLEGMGK